MIDRTTVNLYECCKCEYQWIGWDSKTKKDILPTYCPKCKNPRWNEKYTKEEIELNRKLQLEHRIRRVDNPYSEGKIYESDFIAASFLYDMRPQAEMFELKQLSAIPKSQIEKRHEFMLSIIKDRINNMEKHGRVYYSGYGKSLQAGNKGAPHISTRRRIMRGCKHKPIPEIEEAIYHITEEGERDRKRYGPKTITFYDMWNNPTN